MTKNNTYQESSSQEQISIVDHSTQPFIIVQKALLNKLTDRQLKVYCVLKSYAFQKESCWPSIKRISEDSDKERTQTKEILNELEDLNYINRNFNKGRSTEYILNEIGPVGNPTYTQSEIRPTYPVGNPTPNKKKEINKKKEEDIKKINKKENPEPIATDPEAPPAPLKGELSLIREVFDYYKDKLNKDNRCKLTSAKASKIRARLEDGYTVDELKRVIDSVTNPEVWECKVGKVEIPWIFKNDENVDKLLKAKPRQETMEERVNRITKEMEARGEL